MHYCLLLPLPVPTDWLMCVCVYTPSSVLPAVQTPSSLTQFLSYHSQEKISQYTTLCAPSPLQPVNPYSHLSPHPEHPRPPVHLVSAYRCSRSIFATGRLLGGRLCQSQPAWITYFLMVSIYLVCGISALNWRDTAGLSWWHPGNKACCELSKEISLCS